MMESFTGYIGSSSEVVSGPSDCVSESQAIQGVLDDVLSKQSCIQTQGIEKNGTKEIKEQVNLPIVDLFLNPAKQESKNQIVREKMQMAQAYFEGSDMKKLYPELFKILWHSTLPCFDEEGMDEHMFLSCELAGSKINCSDIFKKVPTDSGMCCAVNSLESLRLSGYKDLVEEMQEDKVTQTLKARPSRKKGLRLTLDLHSNSVSLGSLDKEFDAFSMFIGQNTEFPVLKQRGVFLQPGHEHFVDLSATVVSSNNIKHLQPAARACLFPDEGDLEFYEKYTFSNCMLECAILEAEKKLDCIPWYLPKVKQFINQSRFIADNLRDPTHRPVTHGQLETLTGSWKMTARIRMFRRLRRKLALIACLTVSLPPTPLQPPLCHSGSAKFPQTKSFRRRCDSRNLNLSPLCTLNPNEMLPKWQPEVNQVIVENDKRTTNQL